MRYFLIKYSLKTTNSICRHDHILQGNNKTICTINFFQLIDLLTKISFFLYIGQACFQRTFNSPIFGFAVQELLSEEAN